MTDDADARATRERSRTVPDNKLSFADTVLRFVLSFLIIFLFALSVKLVFLTSSWRVGTGYVSPTSIRKVSQPLRGRESRFDVKAMPLPLYPGAKNPDGVKMTFNGGDFVRCEFDVSASKNQILGVLSKMAQKAWVARLGGRQISTRTKCARSAEWTSLWGGTRGLSSLL